MFEAFQLGPFTLLGITFGPILIWTRLIFLLIGFWLSTEFFIRLAQSANLSLQHFIDKGIYYVLAFFLGGRILAIIAEYKVYAADPFRMLIVWDGGFSFLGAAIGIAVVIYFATWGHRSTFLHWLDALVPATTLGLVFAWLGSFFSGSQYGIPTDMPWGVIYDAPNVRYAVPIHPVQLYYALFYFLLTFLLLIIRKKSKRVGAETLFGIVSGSVATFFFENFRGDFAIPAFATKLDFLVLVGLFVSLGVFALVELRLTTRGFFLYELCLVLTAGGYLVARPYLAQETYELRFSQLLSIIALLMTTVYVVVQRRRYPHL